MFNKCWAPSAVVLPAGLPFVCNSADAIRLTLSLRDEPKVVKVAEAARLLLPALATK